MSRGVFQGEQGNDLRTAGVIRYIIVLGIAILCGGASGDEANESKPTRILEGHDRWVLSLAISPDSKRLASGSDDQTLRVWDLDGDDPKPTTLRRFDSAVTALAFSNDGKRIAVGTWDGELMLCDSRTGKVIRELTEHKETINTAVFDPSGKYFASGSSDDTLIVWDATTGEDLLTLHQGNEYDVTTAAFSPDGERIVTGDGENELKIWDASTGDEIETLTGHEEPVTCAVFLPGGRVVSGSWDDTIRVWNGDKSITLRGHTGDVTALAIDSKGKRIVSASEDKTLRIWDTESGNPVEVLRRHTESIRCVAVSPDDKFIVSGGKEIIRVWPLKTDKQSAGDVAIAIAKKVAAGIEELKKKYPNRLGEFSAGKHLRRIGVNGGFAPGTPSNPELASISYYNGFIGQKPLPKAKRKGRKRQAAEDIYDEKTGVRIYVHFFKGKHRGNDMRPAEHLRDDLNLHLYVEGPAAEEIRADILKLLDEHKPSHP